MTVRTRRTPPATNEPPPPLAARVGLLLTAVSGLLALSVAGLLGPAAAVVGVAAVVAAAAAPVVWPSPAAVTVRRLCSFVLLAGTMVGCVLFLARGASSGIVDASAEFGQLLGGLLVVVLLAQLTVTDKMRDLRVALLLASAMFLLALANEPGPAVVVALLIGWPAAIAVLAVNHVVSERATSDLAARDTAGPSNRPVGWTRIGWLVAVSAVIAALVVLLLPHPPGIHPRQGGRGQGVGAAGDRTTGAAPRTTDAYTSGSMDMRSRGELPDTEVADVPGDSPGLWRGAVLGYYDGVSWRAPADGRFGNLVAGGPHFDLPSSDAAASGPGIGAERRDVVRLRSGFPGVLLAPGRPTSVDVAGRMLLLPGGFFLSAAQDGRYPQTYTVVSQSTQPPSSTLAGTPVAAPDEQGVPAYSLQLPSTLPDRVSQLGRSITLGAADRSSATAAVENYLRANATYRLDSPVPAPGADAVDDFLFVSHTGFCEQFAAAEVVLLRAAGVPARMATGFAAEQSSGKSRTLRGSDAHAWVEVWYPGTGWVASDPTAGTRRADQGAGDKVLSWLHDAMGRLIVAGCVVLVAVLVGLLVAWRRRRARRRALGFGSRRMRQPLPPVLAAFDRLQHALDETGAPRAPAESVGELARRPELRDAASALAVVERTSYGARLPVGAEADDAVRALDELADRLREPVAVPPGPVPVPPGPVPVPPGPVPPGPVPPGPVPPGPVPPWIG
jgi:protein-glutamine gamma-glutamyltransferase